MIEIVAATTKSERLFLRKAPLGICDDVTG
jgi:hypothetical protein